MSMSTTVVRAQTGIKLDRGRVVGLALVWVVLALGLEASRAWAANSACPTADSSTATSCTFTTVGTPTFTVPAGVHSLDVVAVGAAGGTSSGGASQGSGGDGASAEDTAVPVSPDQSLGVTVGGAGSAGEAQVGGAGGTPGGGGAGETTRPQSCRRALAKAVAVAASRACSTHPMSRW